MPGVIHVIDDDEAVRGALIFLLQATGHRPVAWISAEAFLEGIRESEPGIVLTDVRMPGMTGLELVQKLNAARYTSPVIVMTGHGDIALAVEAMKAGVVDFLEKPLDDDLLLRAIDLAFLRAGKTDEDPALAEFRERFETLSPRERDVLGGVVAGKPNKIIAYDLGISPRTVEVYRAGLMTKTRAGSLSELVRMAIALGI